LRYRNALKRAPIAAVQTLWGARVSTWSFRRAEQPRGPALSPLAGVSIARSARRSHRLRCAQHAGVSESSRNSHARLADRSRFEARELETGAVTEHPLSRGEPFAPVPSALESPIGWRVPRVLPRTAMTRGLSS
jgi:hypothetical protein